MSPRTRLVFGLFLLTSAGLAQSLPGPSDLAAQAVDHAYNSRPKLAANLDKSCLYSPEGFVQADSPTKPPSYVYYPTPHLLVAVGYSINLDTLEALYRWAYASRSSAPDALNLSLDLPGLKRIPPLSPIVLKAEQGMVKAMLGDPSTHGFIALTNTLPILPSFLTPHILVHSPEDPRSRFPETPDLFLIVRENSRTGPLRVLVVQGNLKPATPLPCAKADTTALKDLAGILTFFLLRKP